MFCSLPSLPVHLRIEMFLCSVMQNQNSTSDLPPYPPAALIFKPHACARMLGTFTSSFSESRVCCAGMGTGRQHRCGLPGSEANKVSLTRLPGPSVCVAAVTGCVGCVPPGPGVSGGAGGRMLVAAVSRCQRTGVELGGRMDVV